MKPTRSLIALLLIGTAPLSALAAGSLETHDPTGANAEAPSADARSPEMFQQLDTDRDGTITKQEARRSAEAQATFDEVDTDRDGQISLAEWNAGQKPHERL